MSNVQSKMAAARKILGLSPSPTVKNSHRSWDPALNLLKILKVLSLFGRQAVLEKNRDLCFMLPPLWFAYTSGAPSWDQAVGACRNTEVQTESMYTSHVPSVSLCEMPCLSNEPECCDTARYIG